MKVTTVTPVPAYPNVVIELTFEEAQSLYTMLGKGGNGNGTVEGFSELWGSLRAAGVTFK